MITDLSGSKRCRGVDHQCPGCRGGHQQRIKRIASTTSAQHWIQCRGCTYKTPRGCLHHGPYSRPKALYNLWLVVEHILGSLSPWHKNVLEWIYFWREGKTRWIQEKTKEWSNLNYFFEISLYRHILKKKSTFTSLMQGHSSWSTFNLHIVRSPKIL